MGVPGVPQAADATRALPSPQTLTVTLHCVTSPTIRTATVKHIAGSDWERAVAASGIQALSKPA